MSMNKKGMSPVVSTLILIVFAAALGAVVMSWGTSATEEIELRACLVTGLDFIYIGDAPDVCIGDGIILTLKNNGEIPIDGVSVVVIEKEQITDFEVDEQIDVGGIKRIKVGYTPTALQKIVVSPNARGMVCAKQGVEVEEVKEC